MSVNDTTLRLLRGLQIHVDGQLDGVHRHLIEAWASAWNELSGQYHTLMMDLADAKAHGRAVSATTLVRSRRAVLALQASQERLTALCDDLNLRVERTLPDLVASAPQWQRDLWVSQMPPAADQAALIAGLQRVDPAQLEAIVGRTVDTIHARTRPIPYQVEREIKAELVKGVAFGDNPRWTAQGMVARVRDRFDLGMARALVISRTEMLDAHRTAAQLWDLDNADVLAGWQWVATLDQGTCPSCWSMHGTMHELTEPGPEDHQQGRCARLTRARPWSQLGFAGVDEPADALPDAKATFDALTPEARQAIMGRDRLALLDSGKVSWGDLAARRTTQGWRDSFVPRSVAALAS